MLTLLASAEAATWAPDVCEVGCPFSSLQAAIESACGDDEPRLVLVSGVVSGTATIACDVTIQGDGTAVLEPESQLAPTLTVVTATVRLEALTLRAANFGSLDAVDAELELVDVEVSAARDGYGLDLEDTDLVVTRGAFRRLSGWYGGAIDADEASTTVLVGTVLEGNEAVFDGGAIYAYGLLELEDVVATGNFAGISGGVVVAVGGAAAVTIRGGTFGGGLAADANGATLGGAIAAVAGATVEVEPTYGGVGARFGRNTAGIGGAIWVQDARLEVRHADFDRNDAAVGSAVALELQDRPRDHRIEDSTFTRHQPLTAGTIDWYVGYGGVNDDAGSLTVERTVFADNGTLLGAPAIGAAVDGALVVRDSRFERNASGIYAGAIGAQGLKGGVLERNTFCENSGILHGAVWLDGVGSPTAPFRVANNLFLRNEDGLGSALGLLGGVVDVRNDTFVDNDLTDQDPAGTVHADGTSLAFTHGLFVGNGGAALTGTPELREIAHTWFWDDTDTMGFADPDAESADPLLQLDRTTIPCEGYAWVEHRSGTRDVGGGPPDPDGSPTDAGAYGGPQADAFSWSDDDGDDVPLMWDCAREDPELGLPVAFWPDADDDGFGTDATGEPVWACREPDGMSAEGVDCDDARDDVHPGAVDVENDELDQDCDGSPTVTVVSGGACGCRSGSPAAGGLALLALLALRSRRR